MIYLARSRNENRIFPMTADTLLRALKECGSPNPHEDLALIESGRSVRRGTFSFKKVDLPAKAN